MEQSPTETRQLQSGWRGETTEGVDGANRGNETTREMYLTDMYKDPNYWTIRVASSSVKAMDPEQARTFNAINNSSFTHQTVEQASNPIRLGDAFQTFTDHIAKMATYNGLSLAVDDAMRCRAC